MNGNFNGVQLDRITLPNTRKSATGFTYTSFRVTGGPQPELEQVLRLGAPARLIASSQEIEGRLVQYSADLHHGYEIMIESEKT